MNDITAAVQKLLEDKGPGFRFPSDLIWEYVAEKPASGSRPGIVRQLSRDGFIVPTGHTTKAVSDARKGAPTTEYTFGSALSPESLDMVSTSTVTDNNSSEPSLVSISDAKENSQGIFPLDFPLQRIVHGCPGSGKSHMLERDGRSAHFVIRTVFHPESTYSDFVGGLRPQSIYKTLEHNHEFIGSTIAIPGEPYVHYVVQTGALLKAYRLACLNPSKSVVLIIEELSRAVAAHVFGDVLQLLDRVEDETDHLNGYSAYEIEPRPDISSWLATNEIWNDATDAGRMRFPPNLYIWATMNRADQNARQLDAAFLRRWEKTYLSYLQLGEYDQDVVRYGGIDVSWGELRAAINQQLIAMEGIPEDKFVGPYMLPRNRLKVSAAVCEDLWGYLWNDVLKGRAPSFFNGTATFAELSKDWADGDGTPIGQISAISSE